MNRRQPDRRQRKALKKSRRAALACRHHLRVANQVGLTESGRTALAARDDAIRNALLCGCTWDEVIFGPGTLCFGDLYDASEESLRERFGAAADGMLAEQRRERGLVTAIAHEDAHCISDTDIWGHFLVVAKNLEGGDVPRYLELSGRPHRTWKYDEARQAAALLDRWALELDHDEDEDDDDCGWTPETKAEFWAAMEALERRLVAALLGQPQPRDGIAKLVGDMAKLGIGDRRANLDRLGHVSLAEKDRQAPIYRECYKTLYGV